MTRMFWPNAPAPRMPKNLPRGLPDTPLRYPDGTTVRCDVCGKAVYAERPHRLEKPLEGPPKAYHAGCAP